MTEERAAFRRIVVAFGASRESLAALGTWADLAARLRADLSGLFVEDADLTRMAALPFTRIVGFGSVARDFDAATCERLLRGAQAEARTALEDLARRRTLPWSFRAVRGATTAALLENVESGDLVVLEHAVFGAAAVHALHACTASVLYLRPDAHRGREVFVTVAEDDDAPLATAAHLAVASGRGLAVLVRDGDSERSRAALAAAGRFLPAGVPLRAMAIAEPPPLARILRAERGAILVSSAAGLADAVGAAGPGAAEIACSLLVVRSAGPPASTRKPRRPGAGSPVARR